MIILLDPGHYPDKTNPHYDPGACSFGITEADITLDLCNRIAAKLPLYGIKPIVIQPPDEELQDVVNEANKYPDAALFLSIHVNSAANASATGFESFVYPGSEQSDKLRKYIHWEVAKFFGSYYFADRGMKTANFKVLRETTMPAMLFENLFISNSNDAAKLKIPSFLDNLAIAYCTGIARALGTGYTGGENMIPAWASEAVNWALNNKLIVDANGSEDFYRQIVVLYRYHQRFGISVL